jgi:hypothetical protein
MNYYEKYIKYKTKYLNNKKLILSLQNNHINSSLSGGMVNITDEHINTYFKMYNLISWKLDHMYLLENKDLNDYCKSLEEPQQSQQLEKCNPPYTDLTDDKNPKNCCEYKGLKIHKRLIDKFNLDAKINSKDNQVQFYFRREYNKIYPQTDKELYYDYLRELIIKKLSDLDKYKDQILEILYDNDYYQTEITEQQFIDIISSDEFFGLDDIFNIFYQQELTDTKYTDTDTKYTGLKSHSRWPIQPKSMQEHTNKLFESEKEGKKTMHLYFSYGIIENFDRIKWSKQLEIFINEIKKWITDINIECIVLGGHSFGSCVIQYLGLELIKQQIDITKILIIGTGCPLMTVLSDDDLKLFKSNFMNKHIFIINSKKDSNWIIYYDRYEKNESNAINKINTHIMICIIDENGLCNPVLYEIINHNELNHDIYKPITDAILHSFSNYSKLYFAIKKSIDH